MGSLIHLLRYNLKYNLLRHSPLVACLLLMLFTVGHSAPGDLIGGSAKEGGLKENAGETTPVFPGHAGNPRSRRWGANRVYCKKRSPFSHDPDVNCSENTIGKCICFKGTVKVYHEGSLRMNNIN